MATGKQLRHQYHLQEKGRDPALLVTIGIPQVKRRTVIPNTHPVPIRLFTPQLSASY